MQFARLSGVAELLAQIQRSIIQHRLFRPGQKIVVAVSGGLDSMVLLNVLFALARKNRWRLVVAHLNHRLRGRSSDFDERLVRNTARRLKLPFESADADVAGFALEKKVSIEMAARQLRHAFLAQTALKTKADSVALAHHADDQLELFFLRLFRGAGGEGLSGMKWKSPSAVNSKVSLARPFLDQQKQVLKRFADEHHISFREDATNACLDIQRNRIRHELIPLLKAHYQPALEKTIKRVMNLVGAEAELVNELARNWISEKQISAISSQKSFAALPVALQRQCIRVQLSALGIVGEFELVERLRLGLEKDVAFLSPRPSVLKLSREGVLSLRDGGSEITGKRNLKARNINLGKAGALKMGRVKVGWKVGGRGKGFFGKKHSKVKVKGMEVFDAEMVGNKVTLRYWRPGDRFQPIGMSKAIKLQDFFVNQKVPRARRHELLLGVTARGEVFWVEEMRISERFKLTERTNRRLLWHWQRF